MRKSLRVAVLAFVLLAAFVAGFANAPVAEARDAICWYQICPGWTIIVCCEGQQCICPGQCSGDPPVCQ